VNNRRTSVLLREYIAGLDKPYASLGDLRDALGDRGFGVLLFIFALPNLMPVNIPLLSAVLGAPLVLLAAQLTYGRHKPWLPHWLTRQSISRQNFEAVVSRALPYLERAERWLRPRLTVLLSWTGERLIGLGLPSCSLCRSRSAIGSRPSPSVSSALPWWRRMVSRCLSGLPSARSAWLWQAPW
jgi:hypothetical protein